MMGRGGIGDNKHDWEKEMVMGDKENQEIRASGYQDVGDGRGRN
jgi:hypothetical protein